MIKRTILGQNVDVFLLSSLDIDFPLYNINNGPFNINNCKKINISYFRVLINKTAIIYNNHIVDFLKGSAH